MSKVVIYKDGDVVSVAVPAPGISVDYVIQNDMPSNAEYRVVDSAMIPPDRTFRNAWGMDCEVDMDKAKEIWIDKIRVVRNQRLKELDIAWMKAMENGESKEASDIAAVKQSLRDITDRKDIHKCKTANSLKKYWPQILEG